MNTTALQDALARINEMTQANKFQGLSVPLKDKPSAKPPVSWIMEQNIFTFLSAKTLSEFDEVLFSHKHYTNMYMHVMGLFYATIHQDMWEHNQMLSQMAFSLSMNTPGGDPNSQGWSEIYDQLIPGYDEALEILKANKHIAFAVLIGLTHGIS